jgi:hypothetical protein
MILDLNERRRKKQELQEAIMFAYSVYDKADPTCKREILLSLRELHRALPTPVQEELWLSWFRWLDKFEVEEIEAGERDADDRDYIWPPQAHGMQL